MTQLRSAVRLYSSAVHRYSYFRARHSSTRGAARVVVGLLSSSQSDRLHGSVGSGNSLRAGPFVWAVAGVNEKCLFGFPLMGDEDRCSDAPAFASSVRSERVSADDRFMACSPCVAARYFFPLTSALRALVPTFVNSVFHLRRPVCASHSVGRKAGTLRRGGA